MKLLRILVPASSAFLLAAAGPALGDTEGAPPGAPCAEGAASSGGNPCAGNAGNTGANGNASDAFVFEDIAVPGATDRGAFISQIGTGNAARTDQAGSNAYSRVIQTGNDNSVSLTQEDGNHHSAIAQDGDANSVTAQQLGSGETVLLLAQQGQQNSAEISQSESQAIYTAAAIAQNGLGNSLSLIQDGTDNHARLTQTGDNNAMSATQIGANNRLDWTQDGNGLSDLQITQDGGQVMQVTQSNMGAGGN